MKKIISMILVVMLTMVCFAAVGSAATLTAAQVDAANQAYLASSETSPDISVSAEAKDGKILVTYSSDVLEAATDAQATIIIFDATTSATPSAGNMIQIDQFAYDSDVSTYEYAYDVVAGKEVVVMMGGTDIETPGSATLTGEPAGVSGDIDGNGKLSLIDAIMVAEYTVDADRLTSAQVALADFSGDGRVTLVDAVAIAQATV